MFKSTSPLQIIHDAPVGKTIQVSPMRKYDGVPVPPELKYITLVGKSLIILRGPSGCGKSFIAEYLYALAKNNGLTSVICSSDDYFVNSFTGIYKFEGSKIGRAHSECMLNAIKAFNVGIQCIIIDNTHSSTWEYQNYLALAMLFKYSSRILEVRCRNINVLEAFHKRTKCNVQMKALIEMYSRWENEPSAILIEPAFNVGEEPKKIIHKNHFIHSCRSTKQNFIKDPQYTILKRQ